VVPQIAALVVGLHHSSAGYATH